MNWTSRATIGLVLAAGVLALGAVAVPLAGFVVTVYRRYFYQELRAQTTDKGPLHLLGGATYFRDRINFTINGQFLGFTLSPTQSFMHTTSWSVYGQAGYDITDRLNLTASLRYIHEQRKADFINGESNSGREHKPIPSATLSYRTDNGTIYARYAQGYKTGGVNEVQFPSRYLQGCTPQEISSGFCVSPWTLVRGMLVAPGSAMPQRSASSPKATMRAIALQASEMSSSSAFRSPLAWGKRRRSSIR